MPLINLNLKTGNDDEQQELGRRARKILSDVIKQPSTLDLTATIWVSGHHTSLEVRASNGYFTVRSYARQTDFDLAVRLAARRLQRRLRKAMQKFNSHRQTGKNLKRRLVAS